MLEIEDVLRRVKNITLNQNIWEIKKEYIWDVNVEFMKVFKSVIWNEAIISYYTDQTLYDSVIWRRKVHSRIIMPGGDEIPQNTFGSYILCWREEDATWKNLSRETHNVTY